MCMSNNKQLTYAWLIYADDNNGVLVKNCTFYPWHHRRVLGRRLAQLHCQ